MFEHLLQFAGYGLPLHNVVKESISSLVDSGITNVSEIKHHIQWQTGDSVSATNRRLNQL